MKRFSGRAAGLRILEPQNRQHMIYSEWQMEMVFKGPQAHQNLTISGDCRFFGFSPWGAMTWTWRCSQDNSAIVAEQDDNRRGGISWILQGNCFFLGGRFGGCTAGLPGFMQWYLPVIQSGNVKSTPLISIDRWFSPKGRLTWPSCLSWGITFPRRKREDRGWAWGGHGGWIWPTTMETTWEDP